MSRAFIFLFASVLFGVIDVYCILYFLSRRIHVFRTSRRDQLLSKTRPDIKSKGKTNKHVEHILPTLLQFGVSSNMCFILFFIYKIIELGLLLICLVDS